MDRYAQQRERTALAWLLALFSVISIGCQSIKLPAIDPTGSRIFLPAPSSTTLLGPCAARRSDTPARPAFTHPASRSAGSPGDSGCHQKAYSPPGPANLLESKFKSPGKAGEIILTPSRILAPVGSEVVVMAGICGNDGYYVINQPIEWMLAGTSVGHIVEVGGMEHANVNRMIPPSSKKFDGEYAWGRTSLKPKTLTRGTPTPVDDIDVEKGQHYVTLSSPSEGTSYITAVAPKAEAWDKRRASTVIHWIDALWSIPAPSRATSGQPFTLNTQISRVSDGTGVGDWKVRYEIVGGTPAEFVPTGAQSAVVTSTAQGQAPIQIRQPAGETRAGATQVKVDVIRPDHSGQRELVVESGLTSVVWSAPALTIRAIGPKTAGLDQPYNYRLEISNPGDQPSRQVIVRTTGLSSTVQFISSDPKPSQYGDQFQWDLGDLEGGGPPRIIDIQLKSSQQGQNEICFEVSSDTEQLRTQACATTLIAAPCIGLQIDGPTTAQVGTSAIFTIQVVNQCSESLNNVRLQVQYDEGLAATRLANPIIADIGFLNAGEKRSLPLQFDVMAAGTRCFNLNVVADGGHTAAARRCLEASQTIDPNLRVEATFNPPAAAVGQRVLSRVVVTNTGNAPLDQVSVLNQFSPSLAVRQATGPGPNLARSFIGDAYGFTITRLEPNAQQVLDIEFECLQADANAVNKAVVTTPLGINTSQTAALRIDATPSVPGGARRLPLGTDDLGSGLSLNVTTTASPMRIGEQSRAFEVTVANHQIDSIRDVKIALLIPPGLRFVSIDEAQSLLPVAGQSADGTQVFLQTRAELRSREVLTFGVTLIGETPGQPILEAAVQSGNSAPTRASSAVVVVP